MILTIILSKQKTPKKSFHESWLSKYIFESPLFVLFCEKIYAHFQILIEWALRLFKNCSVTTTEQFIGHAILDMIKMNHFQIIYMQQRQRFWNILRWHLHTNYFLNFLSEVLIVREDRFSTSFSMWWLSILVIVFYL